MSEMPPKGSEETDSGLFKNVWAVSESASNFLDTTHPAPLSWILGSMSLILIIIVAIVAYLAIKRSEDNMAMLLAEKGASLLNVFESALRTGMRGDSGLRLQTLLEEMTESPDIEFVAVTMPDGIILAHSDRSRIGEILNLEGTDITADRLAELAPKNKEQWRTTHAEGERVFLLYRNFTLGQKNWSKDVPEPTIFLAMDFSPFEITRSQNRSYVTMLCVVTLLVGLTCLLAIGFAQRAAVSRKSQKHAENEVQRLAAEVRQNEKLAAVGTLAAGVAHEIRNPLSSIKGYATYFRERFPEGSEDREAAGVMIAEVDRLNRVITDLLGLSKPGDANLKPVDLKNVIFHVLRLIRQNASSKNIILDSRIAPFVPLVMADMEKLSQAILNLCLNSIEAMPEGGRLTIALAGGKKRVCLMVWDTGKGIPPEIKDRIFDPYFTTKNSGTGLGLPMAHKLVKAHHGQMDVSSKVQTSDQSGFTIFRIWLPVKKS